MGFYFRFFLYTLTAWAVLVMLALLLGFALAAWLKCDVQLYFALGMFLVGADVSFMFGKKAEYERDAKVVSAQTPPTPPTT